MPFDAIKFFNDFRIPIAQPGNKHYRHGWANITCPFCSGSPGEHMGFNLPKSYFSCYRCGWHPVELVLEAITGARKERVRQIIRTYGKDYIAKIQTKTIHATSIEMPEGTAPMTERHKQYLTNRKFDPDYLEYEFGLLGTGHLGNYRFRIIAPITFKHEVVSFQGRDITDKQATKYKACESEKEVIPHKNILYGLDKVPGNMQSVIIVEGVTGVWRLGFGALATFGSEYTASQVRLLTQRFKRFFLLFDPDEAGRRVADRLSVELLIMNKEVEIWEVPEGYDSGSLPQDYANSLITEIK